MNLQGIFIQNKYSPFLEDIDIDIVIKEHIIENISEFCFSLKNENKDKFPKNTIFSKIADIWQKYNKFIEKDDDTSSRIFINILEELGVLSKIIEGKRIFYLIENNLLVAHLYSYHLDLHKETIDIFDLIDDINNYNVSFLILVFMDMFEMFVYNYAEYNILISDKHKNKIDKLITSLEEEEYTSRTRNNIMLFEQYLLFMKNENGYMQKDTSQNCFTKITEGYLTKQDYWRNIEQGEWFFGDERSGDFSALSMESLEYTYFIGKYPVTNLDFSLFIADGGYNQDQFWSLEGKKLLQTLSSQTLTCDAGGSLLCPFPVVWFDPRYSYASQPVVGVSWYEAQVYCQWLTAKGHQEGWLNIHEIIRLPTLKEWQRAVRHTDRREVPWGSVDVNYDDYVNHTGNTTDAIGRPSVIGCFPKGAAFCGAEDMLGNIREWTSSLGFRETLNGSEDEYQTAEEDEQDGNGFGIENRDDQPSLDAKRSEEMILCGGSFQHQKGDIYCGYVEKTPPDTRTEDIGFRLVKVRLEKEETV